MGDLTKNFSLFEFRCPRSGIANPEPKLVYALQEYRDLLKVPIKITSGGRYGEGQGYHFVSETNTSKAADCIALGSTLLEMYYAALKIPEFMNGGIGIYPNSGSPNEGFLHLDVRIIFGRWARISGKYVKHQEGLDYIAEKLNLKTKPIKQGSYWYDVPQEK
jgi:hypothetical protein